MTPDATAPAAAPARPPRPGVPAVSAVIVTYRQIELTLAAIASLKAQTVPVHDVVVVDNDPDGSAVAPIRAAHPDVTVLREDNIGYAPACNVGAAHAKGDWLFFLNPDAEAEPECLEHLLDVTTEHPGAAIVTPQVLFPDGRTVNAGENQIHLTGIAWCGRYGEPPEDARPRRVFITTGAAMLVRTEVYERLGGYCNDFFLYYEDPDICWRTWLIGEEVWFVPRARVRHDYTWGAGTAKWYYLERHRLLSVLSNFRSSTLLVLAPLLIATELVLVFVAGREGWRAEKLKAYRSVWQRREWVRERRRELEAMRSRTDAEIIGGFQATVDSPQIINPVARRVRPMLRAYAAVARAVVRALGR